MQEIILVSSPLQALVVGLLLKSELESNLNRTLVFCEGKYNCLGEGGVSFYELEDTRDLTKEKLDKNLQIIMSKIKGPSRLWVSDIFWPMNNAIYTQMKSAKRLTVVNFFDEGIVLYWLEQMRLVRFVREFIKFAILSVKMKRKFSIPNKAPFYGNDRNGEVLALHPMLVRAEKTVRPIRVDLDFIKAFDYFLDQNVFQDDFVMLNNARAPALVISQPHYRVTSEDNFRLLVRSLSDHLRANGYTELFVKLHPSENDDFFKYYYEPLGYKKVFQGSLSPLEAKLSGLLSKNIILVSCNSSVLLNARSFGFKGAVISYGLDWLAKVYPFDSGFLGKQSRLFRLNDADVVLSDSSQSTF